jgi:isopentenyl diphosphate isomerase/L-lactate dehydrogenase-like FMN-dependent dehydrogenase
MSRTDWRTIGEIEQAARRVVAPELWDGLIGGAGHEVTLRRNVAALERVALIPRVLRGVGDCDLSVHLLGRRLALPVLVAPIGEVGRFHDDGARAVALGAEGAGSAAYVSVVSMPSLEEVRAASTTPLIFQIYMFGDRAWLERIVRRVEVAAYDALCITVDTPVGGRKDRDLRNRLALAPLPRPNLDRNELPQYFGASLTWDDIAWIRDLTTLPIILKGILHPRDALLAVDHGVDVVHISNHGGQQLDDAPSTFELLGDVVAAVAGRATIVIDSGFSRGTDVIKALALGADAVAMGRLPVMALAAGGAAGVTAALQIIADEIRVSMINLGLGSLNELNEGVLRATEPPRAADREARDALHVFPAGIE